MHSTVGKKCILYPLTYYKIYYTKLVITCAGTKFSTVQLLLSTKMGHTNLTKQQATPALIETLYNQWQAEDVLPLGMPVNYERERKKMLS